jgi:hypothetical protein
VGAFDGERVVLLEELDGRGNHVAEVISVVVLRTAGMFQLGARGDKQRGTVVGIAPGERDLVEMMCHLAGKAGTNSDTPVFQLGGREVLRRFRGRAAELKIVGSGSAEDLVQYINLFKTPCECVAAAKTVRDGWVVSPAVMKVSGELGRKPNRRRLGDAAECGSARAQQHEFLGYYFWKIPHGFQNPLRLQNALRTPKESIENTDLLDRESF